MMPVIFYAFYLFSILGIKVLTANGLGLCEGQERMYDSLAFNQKLKEILFFSL
jgi:hypothetical protein